VGKVAEWVRGQLHASENGVCMCHQCQEIENIAAYVEQFDQQSETMRNLLSDILHLMENSHGVTGWHLSGNVAEWSEFPYIDAIAEALKECEAE
jgi:hypothetical protein